MMLKKKKKKENFDFDMFRCLVQVVMRADNYFVYPEDDKDVLPEEKKNHFEGLRF